MDRTRWSAIPFLLLSLFPCGCRGGGGGGAGGGGPFVLTGINLSNNSVWPLNRQIIFTFSHPVSPASVNFGSVVFTSASTPPVTGVFFVDPCSDGSVVVFQPDCPSNDLLDDGGFKPNGVNYTLTVLSGGGQNVIRDTGGDALQLGIIRTFRSPVTTVEPPFVDTNPSSIPVGSTTVPDPLALNLLSNPIDPILVTFNQSVDPRSTNLNPVTGPAIQLQFEEPPGSGLFTVMPATLTLVSNCAVELASPACPRPDRAVVAITPIGVIPPSPQPPNPERKGRVVVKAGFKDIGGSQSTATDTVLVIVPIEASDPAPGEFDAFHEEFDATANRDATSPLTVTAPVAPLAEWGGGVLRAPLPFPAAFSAIPANQFNLTVPSGLTLILDTVFDQIFGTDGNGNPKILDVSGGVVNLNNLTVDAGMPPGMPPGKILGQGPNPLVINATGTVTINGEINVDGVDATGVQFPNAANIPEPGAPGTCGGGRGGTGSPNTLQSDQKGEDGTGPGDIVGGGGRGGHSCFGTMNPENRRGGGGGGGSFATAGAAGQPSGVVGSGALGADALTGLVPAEGGMPGPLPFTNASTTDDFFGLKLVNPGGTIVVGELPLLLGGAGGGGGGDSIPSPAFPNPTFSSPSTGDDKGSPGGGGGGVLVIRAVGPLTIGVTGILRARGGSGGGGESSFGSSTNHIGGGGGGGAGGMVVLESLDTVVGITIATGTAGNERIRVKGGVRGYGAGEPPLVGTAPSAAGGGGGDGIIQLHTARVNASGQPIVVVGAAPSTTANTPNVDTNGHLLLPTFSARSRARTKWIPTGFTNLGNAGGGPFYEWVRVADPPNSPTNPNYPLDASGLVKTDPLNPGFVLPMPTVPLNPIPVGSVSAYTIALPLGTSATPGTLAGEGFPNPAALRGYELNPNMAQGITFTIVSGSVVGTTAVLSIDPADTPPTMTAVLPQFSATTTPTIRPVYFLVRTGGVENALPSGATIRFLFEGADDVSATGVVTGGTGGFGNPAVGSALSSLAGKKFFRTELMFDLSGLGIPNSSLPLPEIEFFKLPIRF